jgi:hypothetical protein
MVGSTAQPLPSISARGSRTRGCGFKSRLLRRERHERCTRIGGQDAASPLSLRHAPGGAFSSSALLGAKAALFTQNPLFTMPVNKVGGMNE